MNQAPAEQRHPDVLSDSEAVRYLKLDCVAESPEAAKRILLELGRLGRISPIKWGKRFLYGKPNLDAFVASEISQLLPTSSNTNHGKSASVVEHADSGSPEHDPTSTQSFRPITGRNKA